MASHRTTSARDRVRARARAAQQLDPGADPSLAPADDPPPRRPRRRGLWVSLAALPLLAAVALGVFSPPRATDPATTVGATPTASAIAPDEPDAPDAASTVTLGPGTAWRPATVDTPASVDTPAAPAGHRLVAQRPVDPAATALVQVGDRVDVVGLSGQVLTADVEVLQMRESARGTLMVLAVPQDQAAGVAASVAATETTVVLSRAPSPSAGAAAPPATGPAR